MDNPVSAEVYERKAELGGGYRAKVRDRRDGQIHESPVIAERREAIDWARTKVFALMEGQAWSPGYSYKPDWEMHVWTRKGAT